MIDVGKEEIPSGYRTFRIPHWEAANLEPSINAISSPATLLNAIDLPRFVRFGTCLDHARKIIRMIGIDQGPVFQLHARPAEILQRLAVEKFHFAHSSRRSHEPGNAIDGFPPGHFPRTQVLISPFTFLDIEVGSVPSDNLPRVVPQRAGAKQEPAI